MNFVPQALRPQGRDRVHNVEDGLSGSTIPIAFGSPPQARVNPVVRSNFSYIEAATVTSPISSQLVLPFADNMLRRWKR